MSNILGVLFTSDHLLLGLLAALIIVALLGLIVMFRLSDKLRDIENAQKYQHKELMKEVALNSPIRAAIAAVIAAQGNKPPTLQDFQAEVGALTENWAEIEALAEQAQSQLAKMVDEAADGNARDSA
ncbi:hypothetical protein GCM10007972_02060 [Iodidimonas muriae]|uniref:Chemotaxis protein n=1 Tax=Iodidimonas muriae TaxID=261467 RepID=A0ABQ2L7U2_9PROT|nr:hypothetical protein [Iodidimonas muriae]GER06505.1 hypothetical protein JCM17843_08150 [Kordiimonadales bacterium JCM 17843]GGO05060.1 hypothetical protein GCM10007972_02060 [Iodidimonas muriae]